MQNMFPKVGLLREIKGGRKEEKNDGVNTIELHIFVGARHNKMY
jgi:hypothetical protein